MIGGSLLGALCLAAAVAALACYAWLVIRRPRLIRLFTGLGLFLTGLALFQGPSILAQTEGDLNVRLAVVALIAAVAVQIAAALRTRPSWTGEERRAAVGPPA
ncbi:hypothetical protein [Brevundimonas lutea]|uniref:hypothetical protein n=1 Tax=Brevundimonas lutea TaxID=2293980 RepID=UPI000F044D55|nr:hypothetical protein [Brevundimonas lutea]